MYFRLKQKNNIVLFRNTYHVAHSLLTQYLHYTVTLSNGIFHRQHLWNYPFQPSEEDEIFETPLSLFLSLQKELVFITSLFKTPQWFNFWVKSCPLVLTILLSRSIGPNIPVTVNNSFMSVFYVFGDIRLNNYLLLIYKAAICLCTCSTAQG